MSIIERGNPLNLQYCICLVTAASSPLGVRICKSLLKANALVLGIDSITRHETLNAGLGTHFQFEECDINDEGIAAKIIEAAKQKFGLDRLDALVNAIEKDQGDDLCGVQRLTEAAVAAMKQNGKGSVLYVLNDSEKGSSAPSAITDFAKKIAAEHQDHGIRCNVVLPNGSGGSDAETAKRFEDAETHMGELQQSREPASKFHNIGSLVLFLVGGMSESVAGRTVHLDGSSSPF